MLTIDIDRSACCGSCECLRLAPRTFALDAERKAVVRDGGGDIESVVLAAARACPNFAVRVWRGGERLV
jgi:ferredoxin